MDKDGLAFEHAPVISGSAVLKIVDERDGDFLGKNILPVDKFKILSQIVENIPTIISTDIVRINIKKSGETYLLYQRNDFYLIVDEETDVSKALENLALALDSEGIKDKRDLLEYIDLGFPDKVFYKFK